MLVVVLLKKLLLFIAWKRCNICCFNHIKFNKVPSVAG